MLQVVMDLVPVIAAEDDVEFASWGVLEEIVELGVDVGLHGGSILGCRDGYTGRTGGSGHPSQEPVPCGRLLVRWKASVLRPCRVRSPVRVSA
ncbi:hypothetical protein GCM10012278_21970 [Nonomuraea glycinis]|uniref:Uncharacterized protein n=1 Tax=Nonomuraea glycinis TaxID=2047744 RepID=A0A918A4R2_9ACTN|nr:hypothetical protein GCM10012278_21970 [Nonomuraea glycinis]